MLKVVITSFALMVASFAVAVPARQSAPASGDDVVTEGTVVENKKPVEDNSHNVRRKK